MYFLWYLSKYHIHLSKYKHWHSTETFNGLCMCCRHAQHYEYVKSAYETISLMSLHSYWSISFPAMPHLWILQSAKRGDMLTEQKLDSSLLLCTCTIKPAFPELQMILRSKHVRDHLMPPRALEWHQLRHTDKCLLKSSLNEYTYTTRLNCLLAVQCIKYGDLK